MVSELLLKVFFRIMTEFVVHLFRLLISHRPTQTYKTFSLVKSAKKQSCHKRRPFRVPPPWVVGGCDKVVEGVCRLWAFPIGGGFECFVDYVLRHASGPLSSHVLLHRLCLVRSSGAKQLSAKPLTLTFTRLYPFQPKAVVGNHFLLLVSPKDPRSTSGKALRLFTYCSLGRFWVIATRMIQISLRRCALQVFLLIN